jgi:hypothetical protein
MPSVSFKKDELRLLSALVSNHLVSLGDRRDEYEQLIERGESDFYDESEHRRMKDTIEDVERIAVKLSKAIWPIPAESQK